MAHDASYQGIALLISEGSDTALNLQRQNDMRDFASARDIAIVGFLAIDHQNLLSGIKHAIRMCLDHKASHIIIDELETLSLPQKDLTDALRLLVFGNVDLVFARDGTVLNCITLTMMHQLLLLSLRAENQIRSRQIKNALLKKKQKGVVLGSRKFGALASESYIIRQMMNLREQGHSLQMICDSLENNQIDSLKKKKWHPTTVKRILDRVHKPSRSSKKHGLSA